MLLGRTDRRPIQIDLTVTLPNGDPGVLTSVLVALCTHDGPNDQTAWIAGGVDSEVRADGTTRVFGTAVLCGPQAADKTGALVMYGPRLELYAIPNNGTTVAAEYIDTVELP